MCKRRSSSLKRTLVDHNGLSPIGLLPWCLQYAREPKDGAGGIFESVRNGFPNVSEGFYKLATRINTVRNDYVAHQNRELLDLNVAREALREWIEGLAEVGGYCTDSR